MRLELKGFEANVLANGIVAAQQRLKGVDVALTLRLSYNFKQLAAILEPIAEAEKKLVEKHAKRDESGQIVESLETGVEFSDKQAWFNERRKLFEEKFSVELKEITTDILPKTIDADIVAGLYSIIVETPSKAEAPAAA